MESLRDNLDKKYLVLKVDDIEKYLTEWQQCQLQTMVRKIIEEKRLEHVC